MWLEKCADSTFENFYYAIPILRSWQVRKVQMITSPTHLPRAQWLAQILLGAHGIWVETYTVEEIGIPGNRETALKTALDVTRSLLWALGSQVYFPHCNDFVLLPAVDLEAWEAKGYQCEYQGNIER